MSDLNLYPQITRVNWASQRSKELAEAIQGWLGSKPVDFEAKIDDGRLGWKLFLKVNKEPPLDEWGFRFGEIIYHLRSALDSTIVTIAETSSTLTPEQKRLAAFPIVDKIDSWKDAERKIGMLPEPFQKAIKALQPFNRVNEGTSPEKDPLSVLRELSNTDKHHVQFVPSIENTEVSHNFGVEFYSEAEAANNVPPVVNIVKAEFKSGSTLVHLVTKDKISKVHGQGALVMQVQVALSNGDSVGVTHILANLGTYVQQVMAVIVGSK